LVLVDETLERLFGQVSVGIERGRLGLEFGKLALKQKQKVPCRAKTGV
jgi:hypothetical protein